MAREMEGAATAGGPEGVVMEGDLEGAALMRARATAWELAALSFRYPGGDLAGAVASGEWLDAACEVACALGLALPEGFGEGLPGGMGAEADAFGEGAEVGGAEAVERALRVEATRLFVGAPDPVVSPYEGVHRAAADGVQPLLFVNPHSMDVERFMRSCGLGRPEGTNEPLDHVATECELMEVLSLRAAVAAAEEESAVVADAAQVAGAAAAGYGTAAAAAVAAAAAAAMAPVAARMAKDRAAEREAAAGAAADVAGSAAEPASVSRGEAADSAAALEALSFEAAQGAFMAEHVSVWVPGFAQAVIHKAKHPFYRAAAQYLSALVEKLSA